MGFDAHLDRLMAEFEGKVSYRCYQDTLTPDPASLPKCEEEGPVSVPTPALSVKPAKTLILCEPESSAYLVTNEHGAARHEGTYPWWRTALDIARGEAGKSW
jgi:hypothetical protein